MLEDYLASELAAYRVWQVTTHKEQLDRILEARLNAGSDIRVYLFIEKRK